MADGYRFEHMDISGLDGAVRGFFTSRMVGATPQSAQRFPGVSGVAISPKRFADNSVALEWLQRRAQPGGGAVGVQVGHQRWLVGAWVAENAARR